MPKKAEKHYHDHQQSASNVGRLGKKASVTPDQEYKHGERDQAENNATAVNRDAAHPFAQVVAPGFKHEPFVAQVGHGDVQQAGEQGSQYVTMRHNGIQNRREQRERSVAEEGIPGTH